MERIGLEPGTEIGGYRVVAPLGSGAMGTVYRALDADGTPVALKVLHSAVAAEPESRERLRREIAVLGRIRHPGVARVLDAESDADDLFIVTELIDGLTLEDEISQRGALDASDLYDLAEQLHDALEAVHAAGVIHRDLKASNVLLSAQGPVLIDFGIAQSVGDARVTRTGLVMGTPAYLAPELVEGASPSMATDWWGWAAVLAFAATGRPPFGVRPVDLVLTRARAGTVDLAGLGPRRSQALSGALRPDPELRTAPAVVVEQLRLAAEDGDEATEASMATGVTASPDQQIVPDRVRGAGHPQDDGISTGETAVLGGEGTTVLPGGGTLAMPVEPGDMARQDTETLSPAEGVPEEGEPPASGPSLDGGPERDRVAAALSEVHRYERTQPQRRTWSVLALGPPLTVALALWPGRVVIVAVALVLVCRFVGITVEGLQSRRERHGVGAHDELRTLLLSPWYAVRSVIGLIPSVLVAATTVLLTGGVIWWLLDNRKWVIGAPPGNSPQVYQYVVLGSAVVVIVLLWFGPLTRLTRMGARVVTSALVPAGWPVLVLWVVSGILTILLWQLVASGHPPLWSPFPEPADLAR